MNNLLLLRRIDAFLGGDMDIRDAYRKIAEGVNVITDPLTSIAECFKILPGGYLRNVLRPTADGRGRKALPGEYKDDSNAFNCARSFLRDCLKNKSSVPDDDIQRAIKSEVDAFFGSRPLSLFPSGSTDLKEYIRKRFSLFFCYEPEIDDRWYE